jgi:hypothetical protein
MNARAPRAWAPFLLAASAAAALAALHLLRPPPPAPDVAPHRPDPLPWMKVLCLESALSHAAPV